MSKRELRKIAREIREIKSQLYKSERKPGMSYITFPDKLTDPEFKKVNLDMRKLLEKYVPEEKIGRDVGFGLQVYVSENKEVEQYSVSFQFNKDADVFDIYGRLYREYEKEYDDAPSFKRWINVLFLKWLAAEGYKYKRASTYFRGSNTMHVDIDFIQK